MIITIGGLLSFSGCGTSPRRITPPPIVQRTPIEKRWEVSWEETLNINTRPSKCEIYINDTYIGISPLKCKKEVPLKFIIIQKGTKKIRRKYNSITKFYTDEESLSTSYEKKLYLLPRARLISTPPQEPAILEIKAFKDGYKVGHKVMKITTNDPQIRKYIKLNEEVIDTTGKDNTFPNINVPPRDVLIVLEPIPGHVTTTPWKNTGTIIPKEKDSLRIERLKITPNGNHTALVSGKIATATKYISCEQEREKIYTDGSGKVRETKFIRKKISYIPRTITLDNPFGPNLTLLVTKDSSFKGTLQTKSEIFFVRPDKKPYRIIQEKSGFTTKVWDSDKTGGTVKSENYPLPDAFTILPDYAAAYEYALAFTCEVQLDVKEKVSRKRITPEITITPITVPTAREFKNTLLREFGNNKLGNILADETLSSLIKKGFLTKGKRINKDAQIISFVAYVSGEYQVETVHGEYYYFKGSIRPTTTSPISNTVLLIETGNKIRTQQVKESEGGSIISSND